MLRLDSENQRALRTFLQQARLEVFPRLGVLEHLRRLPAGTKIPVTSSPRKGIEPTLALCTEIAALGHRPVPHIAARLVTDENHLSTILDRLAELELRDVFVIGGDPEKPQGPYQSAGDLLTAIKGSKYKFDEIGIAAYPEGHPLIGDAALLETLREKQPHTSYMVTQMCFDVQRIVQWIAGVREQGIRLPVFIGIPGDVDRARLLRIALRIGVGDSARFLNKHTRLITKLLRSTYHPDRLVETLAPHLTNESYRIRGFHIYTFDQIEATETWRRKTIARLESQSA